MEKQTQEWLNQSDYDMDTAEYMHQGGRHIYAVFMCHLAIEKALKGLYYLDSRKFSSETLMCPRWLIKVTRPWTFA